MILKPDPRTAVSGGVTLARIFEEAGLPEGVFHVLPGGVDVGEALVTDPNVAHDLVHRLEPRGRAVGASSAASTSRRCTWSSAATTR